MTSTVISQSHPCLVLTKNGIEKLRDGVTKFPLLQETYKEIKEEVDKAFAEPISVPMPRDLAGGYSHEQHKKNFLVLQKAGVIYQITKDERYAKWIRDVLFAYADLYPKFDRHPAERSYSRGKFFWQCLNDANWLVYVSQAYDCIYDWLPVADRNKLNKNLFRPLADFLSVETPQFFNRIHNHSTWGNAAVGMIGLVMNDEELIERALYGLKEDVPSDILKDNDGGLITLPGSKDKGFLAQIDHSFSPDGYYTEGPYYQRYAMYPFLVFAQALANNRPKLKIFEYKNGVLIKAVYALLNQTNSKGEFFPINDAQKGMSYLSRELVSAVGTAYHFGKKDPALLSIARLQNRVTLDESGLSVASGIAQQLEKPFITQSMELRDGAKGDEGAIGILRSKKADKELTIVMKYSKHGMGHGHFDKLSFSMYHDGQEVFQDYGAARWVNISQKDGGGYLKENNTWAKQTIAHNTVVVNQHSQFNGDVQKADLHQSYPYLFETKADNYQVMSAIDSTVHQGLILQRTLVLIEDTKPLVLDLFKITSKEKNDYDLPFYFNGDVMSTSFQYQNEEILKPMGKKHGYQHVWKEASGIVNSDSLSFAWFQKGSFRTLYAASQAGDSIYFGRVGANDPHFNLRRDPVFIIRRKNTDNTLFANVYEIHGNYTPVDEIATEAFGSLKSVKIIHDSKDYTVVQINYKEGKSSFFAMANHDKNPDVKHTLDAFKLSWVGPTLFLKEKK